jgi:hypothetical protein
MANLQDLLGMNTSVRQIAALLKAKAPPGHQLAYINEEEAQLFKDRGGSGRPHADTGIPSYEEDYSFATPEELSSSGYNAPMSGQGYDYATPQELSAPENQGFYAPAQQQQAEPMPDYSAQTGGQPSPYALQSSYGGPASPLNQYALTGAAPAEEGVAGQGLRMPTTPQGQGLNVSGFPQAAQDRNLLQRMFGSETAGKFAEALPGALLKAAPAFLGARAASKAADVTRKNLQPVAQNTAALNAVANQQLADARMRQEAAYQGQLTPAQIQQMNATNARLAQAASRSGGTIGALQAANAEQAMIENERQQNIRLATDAMSSAFRNVGLVNQGISQYAQNLLKSDQEYAAEFGKLMQNIGSALV